MASKDFKNGKIYCIRNTVDDEVYVGSTTQPLSKRMVKHRSYANACHHKMKVTTHMHKLGVEHFYIELIEECPCDNVEQLNRKEGEWTRKLGTLNSKIQGRTNSEWRVDNKEAIDEYKEANREEILQKKKEYRDANREEILQKKKEYREANKEVILEREKEWKSIPNTCACGGRYVNSSKSQHVKSQKHQNYLQTMVLNTCV